MLSSTFLTLFLSLVLCIYAQDDSRHDFYDDTLETVQENVTDGKQRIVQDDENFKATLSKDMNMARGVYHWSKKDRIIVDTDASVSDATAILVLLRAEELKLGPKVIGITVVSGAADIITCGINIARILRVARRTDIPYFLGANESLVKQPVYQSGTSNPRSFGNDALGDVPYFPDGLPPPQKKGAVQALLDFTMQPNAVIITCGMLTNLALAQKNDPYFMSRVKRIVLGIGAVRGVGNVKAGIDNKARDDPEALEIILENAFYKTVYMVPNDPIFDINYDIPASFWFEVFYNLRHPYVRFIEQISQYYWDGGYNRGLALNDPITVAAYLYPYMIKEVQAHTVTVSLYSDTKGATFGGVKDFSNWRDNKEDSNVNVILYLKADYYIDFLMRLFDVKVPGKPKI